jgi:archaetidylinositol phosphate synthase
MLTKLKQQVQQMLSSQAKAAHAIGLTPNAISAIGFVMSVLSAVAYVFAGNLSWLLLPAVLLLLASGFCDTLDGIIARNFQQASVFGGFLDSLLDRYADALIYAGIIIAGLCNIYAGLAALFGSLLVSYSRARVEAVGIKMESVGLAERAERMLILAAASVVAFFWLPALNWGVILLALLSNFTVLQRGVYAYRMLKKKKDGMQLAS